LSKISLLKKKVSVRYTFDGWENGNDRRALYKGPVRGFPRGYVDEFLFEIDLQPSTADRPVLLIFAILYVMNGTEFWDNNQGKNYSVEYIYNGPSRNNQRFHMPVKPIHKRSLSEENTIIIDEKDYNRQYQESNIEEEVGPTRQNFRLPRCPSFDTYIEETSRYHMEPIIDGFSPFL